MPQKILSIAILVGSMAAFGCGLVGNPGEDSGRIPVPATTPPEGTTPPSEITPTPEIPPPSTPPPHTVARTVTIKANGTVVAGGTAPQYPVTMVWKMSNGVTPWADAMKTWDYDDSSWGETAVCSGCMWSKTGGCNAAGDFVFRGIVDLGPDSVITKIMGTPTGTAMSAGGGFQIPAACPRVYGPFISYSRLSRPAEFAFYVDGVLQCEHEYYDRDAEIFTQFGIPQNGRHLFVTAPIHGPGLFWFDLVIDYTVSEFGP